MIVTVTQDTSDSTIFSRFESAYCEESSTKTNESSAESEEFGIRHYEREELGCYLLFQYDKKQRKY